MDYPLDGKGAEILQKALMDLYPENKHMPKILNLYIELDPRDLANRARLWGMLKSHGYSFVDATDYDSYTSGPCALDSLDAIADDIRKGRES